MYYSIYYHVLVNGGENPVIFFEIGLIYVDFQSLVDFYLVIFPNTSKISGEKKWVNSCRFLIFHRNYREKKKTNWCNNTLILMGMSVIDLDLIYLFYDTEFSE